MHCHVKVQAALAHTLYCYFQFKTELKTFQSSSKLSCYSFELVKFRLLSSTPRNRWRRVPYPVYKWHIDSAELKRLPKLPLAKVIKSKRTTRCYCSCCLFNSMRVQQAHVAKRHLTYVMTRVPYFRYLFFVQFGGAFSGFSLFPQIRCYAILIFDVRQKNWELSGYMLKKIVHGHRISQPSRNIHEARILGKRPRTNNNKREKK